MKRRIFISTGEVSGDLQGALLVRSLFQLAQRRGLDLEIVALGGDRMAEAGATILENTSAIGSIGIFEGIPQLLPGMTVLKKAKRYLSEHPPDVVVMIDYMSANINLGRFVRSDLPTVPTAYFIAPQEWVWSLTPSNTEKIVMISDKILSIFPAEADYYAKHGANAILVGHPLVDRIQSAPSRAEARRSLGIADDEVAIALLPASRQQELKYLMPVMFEAAQRIQAVMPKVRFWIPVSLEKYRSTIAAAVERYQLNATLMDSAQGMSTLQAIAAADLALTKSGTVNLEMALLDVPQVVMYRVNEATAWVMKYIIKFSLPFMSPPNLVEMKPIVPEFLQYAATPEAISAAGLELLKPEVRDRTIADYRSMRRALGGAGVCDRSAEEILQLCGD